MSTSRLVLIVFWGAFILLPFIWQSIGDERPVLKIFCLFVGIPTFINLIRKKKWPLVLTKIFSSAMLAGYILLTLYMIIITKVLPDVRGWAMLLVMICLYSFLFKMSRAAEKELEGKVILRKKARASLKN